MTYQTYYWIAAIATFLGCFCLGSRNGPVHNFIGSMMVAIILGWLIWPFAMAAGFIAIHRRNERRAEKN